MAYGNYYQPYYQLNMQQAPQMQSVPSELVARNYPVAYGNSVTFKDENAPYVYTKTMGFSQLESPRFEKYKLVKEETKTAQNEQTSSTQDNLHSYVEKSDLDAVWSEIAAIKKSIAKDKEVKDEQ